MNRREILERELEILEELKGADEDIMEGVGERMGLKELTLPRIPMSMYFAPGLRR